jgi:anion transporter
MMSESTLKQNKGRALSGKVLKAVIPVAVWTIIIVFPVPEGLQPNAWAYFALFAATMVAIMLEPLPLQVVSLCALMIATVMRYVEPTASRSITWALSGFSDKTIWLIFGAYVFTLGYKKSGLGRRIALMLVKLLGGRTLGLGYAIMLSDIVLGPGTPSSTGRSAGIIFPIASSIPPLFGSEPGPSARKIGSYLLWTAFASTAITSSMFLTALAPNAAALTIVGQITNLEITWTQWFLGFLPVAVILASLLPLLMYVIYRPEITSSKEVPVWASNELVKMGKMTRNERLMGSMILLAILLWITGSSKDIRLPFLGSEFIDPTAVVMSCVVLMLLTRVVEWEEVVTNKDAWNVLMWFVPMLTLAAGLNKVGFLTWLATSAAQPLTILPPAFAMVLLVALFFVIHYFFTSVTAHVAAVLPVVLGIGMSIPGIPLLPFTLLLVYSLGLMGVITPYATGPAPAYFGCGYIPRGDFWKLGLATGLFYLSVLLLAGVPWLTLVMGR